MGHVLGIDVGSRSWGDNGSALIEYNDTRFLKVDPGAISWPTGNLTPASLAGVIDNYARNHDVEAVAIDGPQGWRDPETPAGTPGVGRRSEYECRTQGKAGVYPVTYPRNQLRWFDFSVQLFDALLARRDVVLAQPGAVVGEGPGYAVLECFPTSIWRTSGLQPLPGKRRHPNLTTYKDALAAVYGLPGFVTKSHDDLQAVVAALAAVAVVGGPAVSVRRGIPATMIGPASGPRRVEGFIWDAKPKAVIAPSPPLASTTASPVLTTVPSQVVVYVTSAVLEHVNRTGDPNQAQIAIKGVPGATAVGRRLIRLEVEGEEYQLILGDSHAIWPSHQTDETREAFEQLFANLADRPGEEVAATNIENPSNR